MTTRFPMKKTALLLIAAAWLAGCVQAPKKDWTALQAAAPRSILVVPVVNKSLDVDAPNYVLTTLPVPLAERGYYVLPVSTTKLVLEQEGLYEAEKVREMPPGQLAGLFDADAILYLTINRWDAQYAVLATTVTVEFDYKLVGRDGAELWTEQKTMTWSPQQNNNASSPLAVLISAVVTAAMARAAPNYMPLTRQAHAQVFLGGQDGFPDGPYRKAKDGAGTK